MEMKSGAPPRACLSLTTAEGAIAALEAALPGDLYRLYMEYKRDEWDRFNATVSDLDVERYLDCLP